MRWFILFAFLFGATSLFADSEEGIKGDDELDTNSGPRYLPDFPHLKTCDSLYADLFAEEEVSRPWQEAYQYEEDSIPAYLDTIYFGRLEKMDIKSPFSFQYNEAVRSMILFYAHRRHRLVSKALDYQDLYFPLFEEMLDKYQLPQELKYLAIVESALNPKAKSRAGAVGLWQFMPGTGRLYSLRYNSKVDDRMNIYKSTEAACQHFCDLYARYHDWNLVLAAYNAGPGNVNKAIRRAGNTTDYWEIRKYLPRETQSYVPAFIAVNYMMQYADAHNIQASDKNPFNYHSLDTVYINQNLRLAQIAEWLQMDVQEVNELNPQYKKKYIPGSTEKAYVLTLPNAKMGEFIINQDLILSGISRREYDSQALLEK